MLKIEFPFNLTFGATVSRNQIVLTLLNLNASSSCMDHALVIWLPFNRKFTLSISKEMIWFSLIKIKIFKPDINRCDVCGRFIGIDDFNWKLGVISVDRCENHIPLDARYNDDW